MKNNYKKFAAKSGELFLLAFAGEDPKPAVEMIQEYGLSGLYLSNDNIPNRNSALNLSQVFQAAAKKRGDSLPLLWELIRKVHGQLWQRILILVQETLH